MRPPTDLPTNQPTNANSDQSCLPSGANKSRQSSSTTPVRPYPPPIAMRNTHACFSLATPHCNAKHACVLFICKSRTRVIRHASANRFTHQPTSSNSDQKEFLLGTNFCAQNRSYHSTVTEKVSEFDVTREREGGGGIHLHFVKIRHRCYDPFIFRDVRATQRMKEPCPPSGRRRMLTPQLRSFVNPFPHAEDKPRMGEVHRLKIRVDICLRSPFGNVDAHAPIWGPASKMQPPTMHACRREHQSVRHIGLSQRWIRGLC